jgi:hypothetical protein
LNRGTFDAYSAVLRNIFKQGDMPAAEAGIWRRSRIWRKNSPLSYREEPLSGKEQQSG